MANDRSSHKGLKICCVVTAIFVILFVIVCITLAFTIFKPKEPNIFVHPLGLENITSGFPNPTLNVTLGMIVTIENPNFGSFKFHNSTAYVDLHGDTVAEVPIHEDVVPAHGKINVTTSAELMIEKLISNPFFWKDVLKGSLNMTSNAALKGKVSAFKILKLRATAFSTCHISVFFISQDIETKCMSKIKL